MHATLPRWFSRFGVILAGVMLVIGLVPTAAKAVAPYSVSLSASSTSVPAGFGGGVTLTARANQDIGQTAYYITIVRDGDGTIEESCSSGTTCDAFVGSDTATTITYTAQIDDGAGGDVQATSNSVTITWGSGTTTSTYSVSLSASDTDPLLGTPVTLTATANQDIASTAYYITIFNANGDLLESCGSGTTCEFTVSNQDAGDDTYTAYVSDISGGDVQATSNQVTVTWGSEITSPLQFVDRVAGANRYDTAGRLATSRWTAPVPTVFIVTGANYPDALAAVPAAAKLNGLVLLTQRDTLPYETILALEALRPAEIVVIGGLGVISESVVQQLTSYSPVVRAFSGPTRYETAVQVSRYAWPESPLRTTEGSTAVYLASGEGFADALSGAAMAASLHGPLLLTTRDSLPSSTVAEIERLTGLDQGPWSDTAPSFFVLGGYGAVSDDVLSQLYALGVPDVNVLRLAGDDRYETSMVIAGAVAELLLIATTDVEVVVATGADFPDGLVGGALGQPLLLVPPTGTLPTTQVFIEEVRPSSALILGGLGAVSDEQAHAIDALIAANS